jgi:hypothetical protein
MSQRTLDPNPLLDLLKKKIIFYFFSYSFLAPEQNVSFQKRKLIQSPTHSQ